MPFSAVRDAPYTFRIKPDGKVHGKISGTANYQKNIEQTDTLIKGKKKPEKKNDR